MSFPAQEKILKYYLNSLRKCLVVVYTWDSRAYAKQGFYFTQDFK